MPVFNTTKIMGDLLVNGETSIQELNVNGEISLNNKKITSLATPTSGTDAANKSYVDNEINTISLSIPSKTSDLINDSDFTTKDYVDDKTTIKEQNKNTVIKFWTGSQTEYDSLGTKDEATLYFIEEE